MPYPRRRPSSPSMAKLGRKLDHLHELVHNIIERLIDMSAELDRLTTEVSEMKTVATSSAALIRKLATLIRDNASNPAALKALADDLDATQADLTAAITENTPAEEPPVEPAPPAEPPVE